MRIIIEELIFELLSATDSSNVDILSNSTLFIDLSEM